MRRRFVTRWLGVLGLIVSLLALSVSGLQSQEPIGDPLVNLVCRGIDEVTVYSQMPPGGRRVVESQSTSLFRLSTGRFYISSPDREEYFYNTVRADRTVDADPGRYVSAHYILVFDVGTGYREGSFVHTDRFASTVTSVLCTGP